MFSAILFVPPSNLQIVDQLLLPDEMVYKKISTVAEAVVAIKTMMIRGAPAIAIFGCLSLSLELVDTNFADVASCFEFVKSSLQRLCDARPTAINMADATKKVIRLCEHLIAEGVSLESFRNRLIEFIYKFHEDDVHINKSIGKYGGEHILASAPKDVKVNVLTHCNTGSLATSQYGTALGVIRYLHERSRLECCYFTETRPYNQGSRLTAFELQQDRIAHTLICDNMAAALMASRSIAAVVTGVDHLTANGDAANKIGTYQLAVVAKYHGVPFYVAAPSTSCHLELPSGAGIRIEQRPPDEMRLFRGKLICPADTPVWNPAFDVTPAALITGGIITEFGVFQPSEFEQRLRAALH